MATVTATTADSDRVGFLEERSHARYLRGLIEGNPLPVVLLGESLEILTCNPAFEHLFMLKLRNIAGCNLDQLVSVPELLHEANELSERIMAGKSSRARTVRRRADGELIEVEVYAFPLLEKKRVIGGYALYQDIGEQRRAERALSSAEARNRLLVDQTQDMIYSHTLAGQFISVNRAGEQMTGYTRQEMLTMNFIDIVVEEQRALVQGMMARALTGEAASCDFELATRSGRRLPVEVRLQHITHRDGAHGATNEIQGIARDVTERRQAVSSLRLLSGRLLRLQDEERRRIALELHDGIGQSITAISMYLGAVCREEATLGETARSALAACTELAHQSLRELRTFSHLLHPPLLDQVGLGAAMRWYVDQFSRRSDIQVVLSISEQHWRLPPEVEVALFRVVQESLTNIYRHSHSRAAELRLTMQANRLVLEVRDRGRGFRAQRKSGRDDLARLGVGILGMRERMEQLGGCLEIESCRTGTTVRAILPLSALGERNGTQDPARG